MADRPPASTLLPWQFFALVALVAAASTVVAARVTAPSDVVLICLIVGAAGLVGMATYGALVPLVRRGEPEPAAGESHRRSVLEREKYLVLRSIKELEFDRAMGKVAEADYGEIVSRLRSRAMRLMQQLDAGESGYRDRIERELAARLAVAGLAPPPGAPAGEAAAAAAAAGPETAPACPACGTPGDRGARFCKSCGTKLVALLLAMCCLGVSGRAQEAMPDLRQMAGIPRVVDDLPDGTISVRLVRSQPAGNVVDQPVDLQAGADVRTVKTNAAGRAEFTGIAAGARLKVVAVVDGERLESQEFAAPAAGGVRLLLVASAGDGGEPQDAPPATLGSVTFGGNTRIIIDLGEDGLQVYYLLDLVNGGREAVNPAAPIVLELPGGARGASLLEGSSGQADVTGGRVTLRGPFAPGRLAVNVGYLIPYSGPTLSLRQFLPVRFDSPTVMMNKVGDVNLVSPQLSGRQEGRFDGRAYIVAIGPPIVAGSALTLELSGLPHGSRVPVIVTFALSGLVLGGGAWAAFGAGGGRGPAARRRQLTERREKAFGDLVRIEEQRRRGAIDAPRHGARRAALVAQLEQIDRELDADGGDEGPAA